MVTTKKVEPGNFEWTGEAQELTRAASAPPTQHQ
jgi:hypothetical protein